MQASFNSQATSAEPCSNLAPEAQAFLPQKIRRLSFGAAFVPLFYLGFVICFWGSSSLHAGMNGELLFTTWSDEQSWWDGFFFNADPIRIYTSLFYQVGYLLSQALGIPGSFLGYQIVFGLLLWARAVLLFLIIHRSLPGSFWFAFTVGAMELFHAADGLTNWLGQINQHNYIFWLYLSLFCIAEAFRGTRAVWKIVLSAASAIALYLCMWSYEAAVTLASIAPVILLIGGKLARGERITRLDGFCLLIPWSVLACYTFESIERYLLIGAQAGYQYAQLRKSFSIAGIANDLIFNIYHSLAFWTWLPQRLGGPAIVNGLLASALWSLGILFAARSRANELVPRPRILLVTFISGFLCLIAALSVLMVLGDNRSLARTQFLSAAPASLVWASALWLAAYLLRKHPRLARVAPSIGVALFVFFGASAGYQHGDGNKQGWEQFRLGFSALLRSVPDLLPGTVLVMIAPEANAPAYEDLWFDAGVHIAYPQTLIKGTSWFTNQKPLVGQDLILKNGSWVWQKVGIFLSEEPIPFKNTVIVELNESGQVRVLDEVPSFISESAEVQQAYRPYSRILCGPPSETALNRFQMSSVSSASGCAEPAAQALNLVRASFGLDCTRKRWMNPLLKLVTLGNESKRIGRFCHGLSRCGFDINALSFDVPRPACVKELAISWTCGGSTQIKSTRISDAFGKHVELSCEAN